MQMQCMLQLARWRHFVPPAQMWFTIHIIYLLCSAYFVYFLIRWNLDFSTTKSPWLINNKSFTIKVKNKFILLKLSFNRGASIFQYKIYAGVFLLNLRIKNTTCFLLNTTISTNTFDICNKTNAKIIDSAQWRRHNNVPVYLV